MSNLLNYIGSEKGIKLEWERIVKNMRPHTQGVVPLELYEQRQPQEMSDAFARAYRVNNHRSITKSPFDIAISRDLNAAIRVDATEVIPEMTLEAVNQMSMTDGYKRVTLKEWIIDFVGRYRQTDPNSMVVVLPKHPTTALTPRYDVELPDFNQVTSMTIKTMVWLVPSEDIDYLSESAILFKAGSWVYNSEGKTKPYYYSIEISDNVEEGGQVYIIYPTESLTDKVVTYQSAPYYKIDHSFLPAFVTGGKLQLLVDEMGEYIQYYTPDYWGAAEWGNQAMCQMSDLQICEKRFTYPEKVVVAKECEAVGGYTDPMSGIHMTTMEDGSIRRCVQCAGKGYIVDSSPLGVHIVRKGSGMNDEGDIKDPVKFITPDVTILQHSADRTADYYDRMLSELFVTKQNMTNQSGESKSWDAIQRQQNTEAIVRDLYRIYYNVVASIAVYVGDDEMEVNISLPADLDVADANDALIDLGEAKKAGVSYPIIVEKTKRHLLKMLGNTKETEAIVNYLAKKDKLFGYSPAEITNAIATFGASITEKDKAVHFFGYQVLQDLLKNYEGELDSATIDVLFEAAIAPYVANPPLLG